MVDLTPLATWHNDLPVSAGGEPGQLEAFFAVLGWGSADRIALLPGRTGAAEVCYGTDGVPLVLAQRAEFDPDSVFELRRRAWSARLIVALLIDTFGVRVLDTSRRPSRADRPESTCLLAHSWAELGDQRSQVREIFAPQAVALGSLARRFARAGKRIKSIADAIVDDMEFLGQAPGLESLVQKAMIARFFEERGADPRGFVDARSPAGDAATRALGGPDNPYDFTVLSPELLGEVHERFLDGRRKSSGIFYTPEAVVRYVVQQTVGEWLSEPPAEGASFPRVLDPACGCGTFLLRVFYQLVDWHLRKSLERGSPEDPDAGLVQGPDGAWQVTAEKRAAIAKSSIFGIDLDARAVEITKLSLALAVLQGHRGGAGAHPSPERLKRMLDDNIRVGDSIMTSEQDFQSHFPGPFAGGGFDVVLGNPPYLSYGGRQSVAIGASERDHLAQHYESGGWTSAHAFFLERSAKSWSKNFVSFIVPDQVGHLAGYRSLRALLTRHGGLREVKYWGERVFKGVVTPSLTFVLDKTAPASTSTRIVNSDGSQGLAHFEQGKAWTLSQAADLLDKLRVRARSLRPYIADCGIRTTAAKTQVKSLEDARGRFVPALEGKQIARYRCAPPEIAVLLDTDEPLFRSSESKYTRARFLIRQTAAFPIVGPREHATYFRNSLHALYEPDDGTDVRYLVALLNSELLRFAYVATVREAQQRVFPQVKLASLGALPIRMLDGPSDRKRHDRIVELVDAMLAEQRAPKGEDEERERRVAHLDRLIDREVFDLYELTEAEIDEVRRGVESAR